MLRGRTSIVAMLGAVCFATSGLLLVSGCAGSSTPIHSGTSSGSGSAPSSPGKTAKLTEIIVAVKDGKVSPKTHRVKVPVGSQVRLLVSSDVDDEVHVHGYEIEREIAAGQSVTIDFTANQTGVFEVETHESDLQLLQLQVQ